jgi:anthranilate phosphoribosyltransferase
MIREAIGTVVAGKSLTVDEAAGVMEEIMAGDATPAQIGAFVTALRLKGETSEEIAGMAQVMRSNVLKVEYLEPLVDIVGTGGDSLNTFNISTAAALVLAASGVKVAKHGNRAASSAAGAADVLEACRVKIEQTPEGVARCIDEAGMGFMFAPAFHPAMRHAGGPRREIGIRTVFNILGPLTNPAGASSLVVGIADPSLGERIAQAFAQLGSTHVMVVHGSDGADELTITGPSQVWEMKDGTVTHYELKLEDVALEPCAPEALTGGIAAENAETMERVLGGELGPLHRAIALNAGAGMYVAGTVSTLKEGVESARKVLSSKAALATLKKLVEISNRG